MIFINRLLVTLAHLRTRLAHEALGVPYEVGSSTIGRVSGRSVRCWPPFAPA
ncbi:hypothetical protein [Streptomyces violascens]|uniref:hypothetical protein n=1 Tax=Streptomyces violascens TaxID=67381 RepID=UPI003688BE62